MSYKVLHIEDWYRKAHFEFFSNFDEPFFGVTFNAEITPTYNFCKKNGQSVFLHYLYAAVKAANEIEEFRYRIKNDEIWVYDKINVSPTINREDGSFGFSYMDYHEEQNVFLEKARAEMERVRNLKTLVPSGDRIDTIHFSALPWLKFTSLSHARHFTFKDSIPKMAFGKIFEENNKLMIPVSVHVHHALMDGYHVGTFATKLEKNLTTINDRTDS